MDNVGLDTVENIEEHYIKERGIERSHLDWLHKNYIVRPSTHRSLHHDPHTSSPPQPTDPLPPSRETQVPGKLGKKSGKGGFYDVPAPGSQTVLYFLNIGLAETMQPGDSAAQIMHKGQVLKYNVSEGGKATEILGKDAMPDGIGESSLSSCLVWCDVV